MEYRFLGTTGVKVSSLCLGTLTFGREADKSESAAIFGCCRDEGVNFFDTSNIYNKGEAERILGDLIAGCRDEVFITSKVGGKPGGGVDENGGSSRRNIMTLVEGSLKRLKTDRIDLYLIHAFDENTPLEETLRALNDLVRQGKVLYIGASNFAAWQVMKGLGISSKEGLSAFQCIQQIYNLLKRQAEVEILPLALSENIGMVAFNAVAGGLLTGKYAKADRQEKSRFDEIPLYRIRYGEDWMYDSAARFAEYARSLGFSPASLAVAWVSGHPAMTAPVVGARNVTQIKDILEFTNIKMTQELYSRIASFSPSPPPATDLSERVKSKSV
jgi:aryl-alcohol dehydrogenase-like predicted oxidoreductase